MNIHAKRPWCSADTVSKKLSRTHWACGSYFVYSVEMQEGADIQSINCKRIAGLTSELATSGPSCDRCQSAHCCSVRGDTTPPLCVTHPEGSLPLWMPWTNEDVRKRLDSAYAQVDGLTAELARVRRNHLRRMRREALEWADRMTWNSPANREDVEWIRRNRPRLMRFAERLRATLAQPTGGRSMKPPTYTVRRTLRDGTIHEREKDRRKANPLPCGWCARTAQVQRIQFIDWRGATTAVHACPTHNATAWATIRAEQSPA